MIYENLEMGDGSVEVGGSFKREGIQVSIWLIHSAVWQKPTQHCKAVLLQLKISFKRTKFKK